MIKNFRQLSDLKTSVGLYINPELNSAVQKGPSHQANTVNSFFCTTTASM